jgi:muconate cycloisomerase
MERKTSDSLIVHAIYDNGIEGYGECAPRLYVTGEDIDSVVDVFEKCFIPLVFASPLVGPDDVHALLASAETEGRRHATRNINAALCALDIALLDALAKSRNRSIYSLFGTISQAQIPFSISIPIMALEEIERIYRRLGRPRLSHVKILVGKEIEEARKRIAFVRKLIGSHVRIRLEVNEGWNFEEAVSYLGMLKKHGIFAVEQPLPRSCLEQLKKLKTQVPIPIILDESICSFEDAHRHISQHTCDIINIKLSKCGGVLKSKKIADYAHCHRIALQLGSHVGEAPVLSAANRHFTRMVSGLILTEAASGMLFDQKAGSLNATPWGNELIEEKNGLGLSPETTARILADAEWISSY